MGTLNSIQGTHSDHRQSQSYFKRPAVARVATTRQSQDRQRFQHHLFRIHPGDASSSSSREYGDRNRLDAELHQPAANNGWTCYGPVQHEHPHIVDLRDMDAPYSSLNRQYRGPDRGAGQFVPRHRRTRRCRAQAHREGQIFFDRAVRRLGTWFTKKKICRCSGTIGQLSQCYYDIPEPRYNRRHQPLAIRSTVSSQQRDLFNVEAAGDHPLAQYPGFEASLSSMRAVVDMMDAITDQGEGSTLVKTDARLLAGRGEKVSLLRPGADAGTIQAIPTAASRRRRPDAAGAL